MQEKEKITFLDDLEPAEPKQEDIGAVLGKETMHSAIFHIREKLNSTSTEENISTGFTELDRLLTGGLYPGLYVLGAISSLGKTTFCVQMAEQIAKQGRKVLFVSLEMAREEIVAKMVSRHTYLQAKTQNEPLNNAQATYRILNPYFYKDFDENQKAIIDASINDLEELNDNLYIQEGVGDVRVQDIVDKATWIKNKYGKPPVVFIDYLQILAPYNDRLTDKQNTDKNILELKRLSRDLKAPVVVISSFNRENYTEPVNLTSFKESGAIEYSSDVLIGLQYQGMDYQDGEKDGERQTRIRSLVKEQDSHNGLNKPRQVQLKILKYRNGSKGSMLLDFYPMFNNYEEADTMDFNTQEIVRIKPKR